MEPRRFSYGTCPAGLSQWTSLVQREKAIHHTLNKFSLDTSHKVRVVYARARVCVFLLFTAAEVGVRPYASGRGLGARARLTFSACRHAGGRVERMHHPCCPWRRCWWQRLAAEAWEVEQGVEQHAAATACPPVAMAATHHQSAADRSRYRTTHRTLITLSTCAEGRGPDVCARPQRH